MEMVFIALIVLSTIMKFLKSKSMTIKYSILWLILPFVFLLVALFSEQMINLAHFLGFELLSNMIFFVTVGILFVIAFSLTVIVSNLQKKVVLLTQEIAMLKKENK